MRERGIKMSEKILYCFGEGVAKDLTGFNFISTCSEQKNLINP